MKRVTVICLLLMSCLFYNKAEAYHLYEQLCEVNQEWKKHEDIALKYGLKGQSPIYDEVELLAFHLRLLEKEFRLQSVKHLTKKQQEARWQHLSVLNEYWQLRNCPRNYYHNQRIPVFIDEENRYCAVAYLMFKSGKEAFTSSVRQNSNNIYIRQIDNQEFSEWQKASGLSLDELAWIQPAYTPVVKLAPFEKALKEGKPDFLDTLSANKIYNFETNYEAEEEYAYFSKIFMGQPYNLERDFPKLSFKGKTPNWDAFMGSTIVDVEIYKNEIYVAIDSAYYGGEFSDYFSTLYRWDKTKGWEMISRLENSNRICDLSVYQNQLFIGGGKADYNIETNIDKHHSYLASWDGKNLKTYPIEFEGYVFGLIYKNGKAYIGSVIDTYEAFDEENFEEMEDPVK